MTSKYLNQKCTADGVTFDSRRELARWRDLQMLEHAGRIRGLERQATYELAPGVKFEGAKRAQPALRIKVDFRYWEGDKMVLEDLKSPASITTAFTIRRHLLKHVHGLDIRLTK